jgi:hypothetical protein
MSNHSNFNKLNLANISLHSERGKQVLEHQGYIYNQNQQHINKDGICTLYWICSKCSKGRAKCKLGAGILSSIIYHL